MSFNHLIGIRSVHLLIQYMGLCLFYIGQTNLAFGQDTPILFEGVEGHALIDSLQKHYSPQHRISYSMAKDRLYDTVCLFNDSVTCIYTGYRRYLDKNEDPSSFLYDNNSSRSMNAEHIFPRSKGADGLQVSDLHNLYPCKTTVNSARNNHGYANVDEKAIKYIYTKNGKAENNRIVSDSTKSQLSYLSIDQTFEPRDASKGNVARSVFYFYTLYRSKVLERDSTFFQSMRMILLQWHKADPVDLNERERSRRVAAIQKNENPFIIDPTLAERIYLVVEK